MLSFKYIIGRYDTDYIKPSIKYVIARYNENIDWTNELGKDRVIYNKGTPLNIENEVFVENVGRESETYLRYIIDNYHNLPDVIVFTQGNISDHVTNENNCQFLKKIAMEALIYGINHTRMSTCHDINNILWGKRWNHPEDNLWYLYYNYKDNILMDFGDWFEMHIKNPFPNPFNHYENALFAVRKDRVLANSLDYYKKLIKLVNWHNNPIEGHFFERSWYYIFEKGSLF